jgi:hypothetical protein
MDWPKTTTLVDTEEVQGRLAEATLAEPPGSTHV